MIAVCTPCRDVVHAKYTYDLVYLLAASKDCVYSLSTSCTILPNTRNRLLESAVAHGMTHVLFIDSDMRFPPEGLNRLLSHDMDIVGANYRERCERGIFTASRKGGQRIDSKGKSGLEQADFIGMGFTLIKCDSLIPVPRPWFSMPYNGDIHLSDDVYFCQHAAEHGLKVYVDHDLSQQVKHIDQTELAV